MVISFGLEWRNHTLHCLQTRKIISSSKKQDKQSHKGDEIFFVDYVSTTLLPAHHLPRPFYP
jgi:hypothetical protein